MASAAVNYAHAQREAVLRPVGTPHGVWVDAKICNSNSIALCQACKHKFDPKRHNYIPTTRWGLLVGRCDGCRKQTRDQVLFIHESGVCDTNGRIRSGHVYTPE